MNSVLWPHLPTTSCRSFIKQVPEKDASNHPAKKSCIHALQALVNVPCVYFWPAFPLNLLVSLDLVVSGGYCLCFTFIFCSHSIVIHRIHFHSTLVMQIGFNLSVGNLLLFIVCNCCNG